MPEFIGYKTSNFDPARYLQEAYDNHDGLLTTEDVLRGIGQIAAEYDADPERHWLSAMKGSPMYLEPGDEA